jgi:hypothetical protein
VKYDGPIANILGVVGRLIAGDEISTRKLIDQYGLKPATAKRYMTCIEAYLPVETRFERRARFIRLRAAA